MLATAALAMPLVLAGAAGPAGARAGCAGPVGLEAAAATGAEPVAPAADRCRSGVTLVGAAATGACKPRGHPSLTLTCCFGLYFDRLISLRRPSNGCVVSNKFSSRWTIKPSGDCWRRRMWSCGSELLRAAAGRSGRGISPGPNEKVVSNKAEPTQRHRLTAGFLARPPAVGPGSREALARAAGGAFSLAAAGGLRAAPGTATEAERRPGGAIAAIAA